MSTNRRALIVAVVGLAPAVFVTDVFVRAHRAYRTRLAAEWIDRGESALRRHNTAAAVDDFHAAAELAPQSTTIGLRLAAAFTSASRPEDARRELAAFLEVDPPNGPVNLALARLSADRGDRVAALAFYDAAINGRWDGSMFSKRAAAERERQRLRMSVDRAPPRR